MAALRKPIQLQFLLRRNAVWFSVSSAKQYPVQRVSIIGSGVIGPGVAQVAACTGHRVTLIDQSDSILENGLAKIKKSLQRVAKKKFLGDPKAAENFIRVSMSKIQTTTSLTDGVKEADLVIEAVIENMKTKHQVFSVIDKVAPSHTMFASNTSSLSLEDISKSTSRLDRFGGIHFFNPVPMMALVEVARIKQTNDETFNSFLQFVHALGKTPVSCKDSPGFIVNRLLVPYMMEAIRMVQRGDASVKDIDTAMKLGAGYPMGPFELADYIGLDTTKFIIDGWHERFPEEDIFNPSEKLNSLVKEGKFGRKTGEGFYKYSEK